MRPTPAGIAAALFWHYGFAWYDLSGESPQKRGMKPGRTSFANGGAFHDGKMFFWSGKGYYIVDPLDTTPYDRAKFCPLPSVDHGGKIFIDGNKAAVVMRWLGLISTFDLTNPDKPKLLEKYKITGHPDPGVFLDGRLIVPCGYAGLMIEKVKR